MMIAKPVSRANKRQKSSRDIGVCIPQLFAKAEESAVQLNPTLCSCNVLTIIYLHFYIFIVKW
jgi:hypothetical protein